MQHRRGFFQTIAGAIGGAALVPTTILRAASTSDRAWLVASSGMMIVTLRELFHSSLRLLGVLADGERASEGELAAGLFALHTMAPQFQGLVPDYPLRVRANEVRRLRFALADELAPEYGRSVYWATAKGYFTPTIADLDQMIDRWNRQPLLLHVDVERRRL